MFEEAEFPERVGHTYGIGCYSKGTWCGFQDTAYKYTGRGGNELFQHRLQYIHAGIRSYGNGAVLSLCKNDSKELCAGYVRQCRKDKTGGTWDILGGRASGRTGDMAVCRTVQPYVHR